METDLSKTMLEIANKQFEIIGVKLTFKDIPEDGLMIVGKKKDYWYNLFHFTEEQEKVWKAYASNKLKGNLLEERMMDYLELRYGLSRSYKKKGG